MQALRDVPAESDIPELARTVDVEAPLAALLRFPNRHLGHRSRRLLDAAETALHMVERGRLIDIADHDHRGVVGVVVGVVEATQYVAAHPLDVVAPADGRMAVGVLEVGEREGRLHQQIKAVVLARVELVEHHHPFALEIGIAHQRAAHPIGLDVHRQRQPIYRQDLEVVGAVEPGRGIERRSHPVQLARSFGAACRG